MANRFRSLEVETSNPPNYRSFYVPRDAIFCLLRGLQGLHLSQEEEVSIYLSYRVHLPPPRRVSISLIQGVNSEVKPSQVPLPW